MRRRFAKTLCNVKGIKFQGLINTERTRGCCGQAAYFEKNHKILRHVRSDASETLRLSHGFNVEPPADLKSGRRRSHEGVAENRLRGGNIFI